MCELYYKPIWMNIPAKFVSISNKFLKLNFLIVLLYYWSTVIISTVLWEHLKIPTWNFIGFEMEFVCVVSGIMTVWIFSHELKFKKNFFYESICVHTLYFHSLSFKFFYFFFVSLFKSVCLFKGLSVFTAAIRVSKIYISYTLCITFFAVYFYAYRKCNSNNGCQLPPL